MPEPKTADNFNPEEAENLEDVCAILPLLQAQQLINVLD